MPAAPSTPEHRTSTARADGSRERTSVGPTPTNEARQFIDKIASNRLHVFEATIDPATGEYLDDPYAQNKSLSEHVAADYHGRFLIELIQNGNDAHPRERGDGEIEALLADEGPFGTVYVANRGLPFSGKNADALSRIGSSSKPPGEAIGNKGLGFRSVSHVCDAPEVYSQSDPALPRDSFQGFCFTLEHGSALRNHFDDPRIGRLAEADLPMFSVPRWLSHQPRRVTDFAKRGFASVIRLVLRDEEARADALGQFRLLTNQTVPTLLFMERLNRLAAFVEGADTPSSDRIVLTRSETPLPGAPLDVSTIDLGQHGSFLLTKAQVPEQAISSAIVSGVAAKQLHGSWKDWSGDGEVALAVRLDHGPVAPRLYTFLPMSQAAVAPFHGYLHGSFFPTSSRTAIDARVELNRLLLDEAASLAALTVQWLAGSTAPERRADVIDDGTAARAAVDLLAWSNVTSLDGATELPTAVARRVANSAAQFADAAIVPCLNTTQDATRNLRPIAWYAPRAARFWSGGSETFTAACIADHGRSLGIAPLWPGLGKERAKETRWVLNAHAEHKFLEHPTSSERARIAESLARSLPRGRKVPVKRWRAFYRDLVNFMNESPLPLVGRQVVLCGDGMVRSGRSVGAVDETTGVRPRRPRRRGEKVEASLFFPPAPGQSDDAADETDDDLRVPSPLKGYFAFASEALPWHKELKGARDFLLEGGLVSAYDGRTVLTRISQVVSNGATAQRAVAGLRWAFAIWRRAGGRLLGGGRKYRLLVPNAQGGLISATDAVFSESWPSETLGKRLKKFLDAAPADVADLVDLRRRCLAPTSHRAFRKTRTAQWVKFLSELGVNRGLLAVRKPSNRRFRAHELTSFAFCDEVQIPKAAAESWRNDVERFVPGGASLAHHSEYSIGGPLWWLPGQADHESFSNDCRELYAALVVEWLDREPGTFFSVEIRHYHFRDTRQWPTPVAAFLRSEKWMPADDPQPSGAVRGHFAPCAVWSTGTSSERFPYFLRQPAVALSRAIERLGEAGRERLTKNARLHVLGEETTLLDQARFLAEQFSSGTVNRHYEPQFVNLYSATWKAIADRYAANPSAFAETTPPELLVVRRGSELFAVAPGAPGTPATYVRDNDDAIASGLISAAGGATLEVRNADPTRVGVLLSALYGDRVRLFSGLHYDVRADNVPISELPRDQTVLDVCTWLRPMAAFAIEALTGTAAGQLPSDRSSLLARLHNVGLRFATNVDFELDGTVISPAGERRAYLFRRADGTPLVVARDVEQVTWAVVEDCLPSICDAIDLPQIATSMRLLTRELMDSGAAIDEERIEHADLARLGRALYLDEHAVAGAHHLLGDQFDVKLPWVRAVVHLVGGADALDTFDRAEVEAVGDPNVLRDVLTPLLVPAGMSSDTVIDACRRSFKTEHFREHLQLTLASFNASLIAIGSEPETHPQLHAHQVRQFVVKNEVEIIQALRNTVAKKLDRREPAPGYVRLRDDEIRSIVPDPAWRLLYKRVPDEIVATHVKVWLAQAGAPPLGENPNGLPPLQAVRKANLAAVARFAGRAAPLVRTWCDLRGREIPEAWTDQDAPGAKFRGILESGGIIDFRELDDAGLLAWCVALDLWPKAMEETLDRATLGIETTDIEAADAKAREEAERRKAKARSVRFDGRDVDPETADWTVISDVVADKLSRRIKGMALGTLAGLAPVTKRARGVRLGTPGRSNNLNRRIPQAKKDMIGRLGELLVYHWLKERFPKQDIDAAWVSKNGNEQLGRSHGSDRFGFDFRVEYKRQTWQIEVKASVGDQQRFEMGETEVRAAREASQPRSKTRYVVVYVANPHDPANAHIDVLPNPMSSEADGVLDLLGEGVRFGFKRR